MDARKILIIDGQPDADPACFVHALAAAYAKGASHHEVRTLKLAELDFPLLRANADWIKGTPPPAIAAAQADITWAEHLVILYPLWLGDVPALLKGFLEQVMRPDFALRYRDGKLPEKLLKGRSARLVVTMGMPAFFYKLVYRAHSVKSLERNVLNFVGIAPVTCTIFGLAGADEESRRAWLDQMESIGARGD